jgi:hypothetical protein
MFISMALFDFYCSNGQGQGERS